LDEKQQKTERKAIIQTSIFSIFSPIIFIFAILFSFGDTVYNSLITRLIAGIVVILVPVLYYFIVMRPRRNDVLIDSHNRRIKISLIIQMIEVLVLFVLPFGYMIFFTQPVENEVNNGHWDGSIVLYLLAALIAPVIIFIGGCVVKFFAKSLKLLLNLRKYDG